VTYLGDGLTAELLAVVVGLSIGFLAGGVRLVVRVVMGS
jgi:hypothetical protein